MEMPILKCFFWCQPYVSTEYNPTNFTFYRFWVEGEHPRQSHTSAGSKSIKVERVLSQQIVHNAPQWRMLQCTDEHIDVKMNTKLLRCENAYLNLHMQECHNVQMCKNL